MGVYTFTNLDIQDISKIYKWYQSGDYPIFFRHFDDFLNYDEFSLALNSAKWLMVEDKGVIALNVHPKPKTCKISIMLEKEYQRNGLGLKTMIDIIRYLFNNGIERVICLVVEDDSHTVGMCVEGGFDREGVYINSCKIDNLLHNEIRFGMNKEKFGGLYE